MCRSSSSKQKRVKKNRLKPFSILTFEKKQSDEKNSEYGDNVKNIETNKTTSYFY